MTDTKLPKLADGSRWNGNILIDRDNDEVSIDEDRLLIDNSCGCGECYPVDALAVIRRAGLDPLAIAAAELAAILRRCDDPGEWPEDNRAAFEKLETLL